MSVATCSTCGKQDHVYLEIDNDLNEGMLPRELYFCELIEARITPASHAPHNQLKTVALRDSGKADPSR